MNTSELDAKVTGETSGQAAFRRLTPIHHEATAGIIADQIRELVADGGFPQGSRLTESALAGALGLSRGPIREALQRLVQEGLLRSDRNRGIFVPELTTDDIIDIYRAREAIEVAAMKLVMSRPGGSFVVEAKKLLVAMGERHEARDRTAVTKLDFTFHLLLIEESRSPRLARAFATLTIETRMCLHALQTVDGSQQDSVAIHQRMVDAIESGSMDAARAAVAFHNQTVLRDFGLEGTINQ